MISFGMALAIYLKNHHFVERFFSLPSADARSRDSLIAGSGAMNGSEPSGDSIRFQTTARL
jgi:hypothetical protein